MANDRPWFKFYARDWQNDRELHSCSPLARSVWIEMMCLMHEDGSPYGHLQDRSGRPFSDAEIARYGVFTVTQVRKAIVELGKAEVFSRSESGVIYSRRMVRDELKRLAGQAAALNGGGHPRQDPRGYPQGHPEANPQGQGQGHPQPDPQGLPAGRARHARAHADSGSVSLVSKPEKAEEREPLDFEADAFCAWFEEIWLAHPKKKARVLAESAARRYFGLDLAVRTLFARNHALWCATEPWTEKAGNYAPALAEWIEDLGWKTPPPGSRVPREVATALPKGVCQECCGSGRRHRPGLPFEGPELMKALEAGTAEVACECVAARKVGAA